MATREKNAPSPKEIGDGKINWTTGPLAHLLEALSRSAFEAIKVIEHERFGIRGGDGYWRGSDKIEVMATDLSNLCDSLKKHYEKVRKELDDEIPL
jgi:hypothetical protein